MEIEPRYPMFGGWKTSFTIGYGLPLQDFLFQSEETRFLNITFGSPMNDILVENLTVKVKERWAKWVFCKNIFFCNPFLFMNAGCSA